MVVAVGLYSCQQEKTAYMDNQLLKDNYKAMQASNQKFDAQQKSMQSDLQGQAQKFQAKVQDYQEHMESMSRDEQEKQREKLMKEQQELQQKQQMQQSLMMQQKQSAQDSLENIMKTEIKKYAKSHGYTYVFGMNENDNILYAEDSKDITQDILSQLNGESGETTTAPSKSQDSLSK